MRSSDNPCSRTNTWAFGGQALEVGHQRQVGSFHRRGEAVDILCIGRRPGIRDRDRGSRWKLAGGGFLRFFPLLLLLQGREGEKRLVEFPLGGLEALGGDLFQGA